MKDERAREGRGEFHVCLGARQSVTVSMTAPQARPDSDNGHSWDENFGERWSDTLRI
jgi:hypothetical protein